MCRVTLFTCICFVSWGGIAQEDAEMVDSCSVAEVSVRCMVGFVAKLVEVWCFEHKLLGHGLVLLQVVISTYGTEIPGTFNPTTNSEGSSV